MGRMRVKLDGKGAFTWAASERNVSKLERDVRAAATAIMADPKAISAAAVDEVLTNGLDLDGLKRQRQATAISITCFSGKRARTSG